MKIIGTFVILLIVIVGGWFLLKGAPASAPQTNTNTATAGQTSVTTTSITTTTATSTGVTVVYGAQGFSPARIFIPVGTTVTFVNQSADEMWIASDPHPTHQGYDGTTKSQHCAIGYSGPAPLDECSSTGTSFTFTFTKVGTWGYHNHGAPANKGTIVVTAAGTPIPK